MDKYFDLSFPIPVLAVRLACALALGAVIAWRPLGRRPVKTEVRQALLVMTVAAALVVVVIGDSLARAFGVVPYDLYGLVELSNFASRPAAGVTVAQGGIYVFGGRFTPRDVVRIPLRNRAPSNPENLPQLRFGLAQALVRDVDALDQHARRPGVVERHVQPQAVAGDVLAELIGRGPADRLAHVERRDQQDLIGDREDGEGEGEVRQLVDRAAGGVSFCLGLAL